jgi:hypothetical protein
MTKAVRLYFNKKRYCYPDRVGINLIKILNMYGKRYTAVGTEEGAMVVHYPPAK